MIFKNMVIKQSTTTQTAPHQTQHRNGKRFSNVLHLKNSILIFTKKGQTNKA